MAGLEIAPDPTDIIKQKMFPTTFSQKAAPNIKPASVTNPTPIQIFLSTVTENHFRAIIRSYICPIPIIVIASKTYGKAEIAPILDRSN